LSNVSVDAQLQEIFRKMDALPKKLLPEKDRRKILVKAKEPLVTAARANVKDSEKTHYIYRKEGIFTQRNRNKHGNRWRAKFISGNLKMSIKQLRLRRTRDIFVGPKAVKKMPEKAQYGPGKGRVNAYYGHMVHYGTAQYKGAANPYLAKGLAQSSGAIRMRIEQGLKNQFNKYQP